MIDQHVHSYFSKGDSLTKFEDLEKKRIELNLDYILVTDHLELVYTHEAIPDFDAMLSKFPPNFLLGVEIGYNPLKLDKINQIINKYPFNTILLSIHKDDRYKINFFNPKSYDKSEHELIIHYFKFMLEGVNSSIDFDILTHMGYVFRNIESCNYYDYDDYIKPVLKTLIDKNKTLEINTADFRYKSSLVEYYDHLLELYVELGGVNISFGSDAHKINDFYYGIDIVKELCIKHNINKFTQIYNRKIEYIDIEKVKC